MKITDAQILMNRIRWRNSVRRMRTHDGVELSAAASDVISDEPLLMPPLPRFKDEDGADVDIVQTSMTAINMDLSERLMNEVAELTSHVIVSQMSIGQKGASLAWIVKTAMAIDEDSPYAIAKRRRAVRRNRPARNGGIITPMGFEYSFLLPTHKRKKDEQPWQRDMKIASAAETAAQKMRDELNLPNRPFGAMLKESWRPKVYVDAGNVIEVTTPVHRTLDDAIRWYRRVAEAAKKVGLRAWSPKRGGGGLHVNVSYLKRGTWPTTYYNLFMEVANAPWLCWAMNEPSDNKTAKCLWSCPSFRKFIENPSTTSIHNVGNKSFAIAAGVNCFEMRGFDMARSERDLLDVIRLVDAMHRRAISLAVRNERVPSGFKGEREKDGATVIDIGIPPRNKIEAEFRKYIKLLGLRWEDYRRFAQRNLQRRLKRPYGRAYLV